MEPTVKQKNCCVPNCYDNSSKRHRFPKGDAILFDIWINRVNNPRFHNKTKEQIWKSYFICDRHFKKEFRVPGTHRGLVLKAYPTLHLPTSLIVNEDDENNSTAREIGFRLNMDAEPKQIQEVIEIKQGLISKNHEIKTILTNTMDNNKISSIKTEECTKDIHKICRACMKNDGIIDLFEVKQNDLSLQDLFRIFSILQAHKEDGLPQKICKSCADFMTKLYFFKKIVVKNQIILQNITSGKIKRPDNPLELIKDSVSTIVEQSALSIETDGFDDNENNETLDDNTLRIVEKHLKEKNKVFLLDHDYVKIETDELTCPCCNVIFDNESEFINHRIQEHQVELDGDTNSCPTDYTCLYCKLKFKTRLEYFSHMRVKCYEKESDEVKNIQKESNEVKNTRKGSNKVRNTQIYTCSKCNLNFSSKTYFLNHRRRLRYHGICSKEQSIKLEYLCSICGYTFNSRVKYSRHLKEEKEKKLQNTSPVELTCPYCKLKFYSRSEYLKHRKEEARKKSVCPYCKKIMHTSVFDNHLRLIHKKLPPLKCETCGLRFVSESCYNRHVQGHKQGFFCEICGRKYLTDQSLKSHKKVHEKTKHLHKCHICSKIFKHLYLYRDHMYTHTGLRPYLCSVCGKTFSTHSNMQQHILTTHTDLPFNCSLCGRNFQTEKKLQQHIQRHENRKNNECEICGLQFMKKCALARHLQTHVYEEKPLKEQHKKPIQDKKKEICQSCNKTYVGGLKVNFQIHIRSHLGESPYLCLVCGKQFNEENEYNVHKALHGNKNLENIFTCDICFRKTGSKAALKIHLRYHTGEKPFACNYCGKCFGIKGNLVQHEKIHRGQRDYMCNVCEKRFITGSSLKKHRQVHLKKFGNGDFNMPLLS